MSRISRAVSWGIATWFGLGLTPGAPGTAGTLGAIPLYLLLAKGGWGCVGVAAIVLTALGVRVASLVARELRVSDPQVVVVDEVAGFLVTMLPIRDVSWTAIMIGVVVFRLFDIAKPWPARALERLPAGWGIMLDDTAAGLYGAGTMAALRAAGVMP